MRARLDSGEREWREQLSLKDEVGARVLLWACTPLPDVGDAARLVIVFDDVTALLNAQRSAAWGEVARRLAHEIKNPLTPIQLSAEQLRRQLLRGLDTQHARMLERATHTIVQQVDAIKQMVDAFSEYARAPEVQLAPLQPQPAGRRDGGALPAAGSGHRHRRSNSTRSCPKSRPTGAGSARSSPTCSATPSRPCPESAGAAITVRTRWVLTAPLAQAEITISDNGPGFREDILGRAFEPYVTSKARGTGLGLAIVQRIVEEHGGRISAENLVAGGARVRVLLPATADRRTESRRERA